MMASTTRITIRMAPIEPPTAAAAPPSLALVSGISSVEVFSAEIAVVELLAISVLEGVGTMHMT